MLQTLLFCFFIVFSSSLFAQTGISLDGKETMIEKLSLLGRLCIGGTAKDVAISGDYAVVADGKGGAKMVNISDPSAPGLPITLTTSSAKKVRTSGNYAYVVSEEDMGFTIVDIANPLLPVITGTYTGIKIDDLVISGNYAYVLAQTFLLIIDISDPAMPRLVTTSSEAVYSGVITVSGEYVYMSGANTALKIIDIANPTKPVLVATLRSPALWSRALAISGSYAYVWWDGGESGSVLKVIDISDPKAPVVVGSLGVDSVNGIAILGNYAYVVSDSGVKIIDISNPAAPILVKDLRTYQAKGIAAQEDYCYIADDLAGLKIMAVSDPLSPFIVGSSKIGGDTLSVVVAEDYAYIANGKGGFKIANVQDPAAPSLVSSLDTEYAATIAVSGHYAYVLGKGLKIINIADPLKPQLVGSLNISGFGITVAGNYAYVGGDKFQIIDVSVPSAPAIIGILKEYGDIWQVKVSGNYAYLLCYSANVMAIVDISTPSDPVVLRLYNVSVPLGLAISENYAYITNYRDKLRILDIANPSSPIFIGSVDLSQGRDLVVSENYAYVADAGFNDSPGLKVVDVANPAKPYLVGKLDAYSPQRVAVSGDCVYLADDVEGLKIIEKQYSSSSHSEHSATSVLGYNKLWGLLLALLI